MPPRPRAHQPARIRGTTRSPLDRAASAEQVTSDQLSAVGLLSMVAVGVGFALFPWTPWAAPLVIAGLVANWFGDSLDGTVARVRGLERPRYGFYVDHVIDLMGTTFLFGGLAFSGLMSPILALVLLAAYLLVCAETYLATHAASVFRMSFLGFGPPSCASCWRPGR